MVNNCGISYLQLCVSNTCIINRLWSIIVAACVFYMNICIVMVTKCDVSLRDLH